MTAAPATEKTVSEIRQLKERAEETIVTALKSLSKDTGLAVKGVDAEVIGEITARASIRLEEI